MILRMPAYAASVHVRPLPVQAPTAFVRIRLNHHDAAAVAHLFDVVSGLEAGLRTILVMTGSTRPHQVELFPYRPTRVVDSIADVVPLVAERAPDVGRDDGSASAISRVEGGTG